MRWALDDDGRAEMPLTEDRDETFPCGIGISLNSTSTITEGILISGDCSFLNAILDITVNVRF